MPEAVPGPALDPQLRAALERGAEIARSLGPPAPGVAGLRSHQASARAWWNEGGPALAEVRDDTVPGPRGPIAVTLYRAAGGPGLRPAYVYLHGGGYRFGGPRANDRQLRELAAAWGGIVVSADYAHVPEQVFPTAVEDTAALYRWLAAHGADWGIDGSRLACGGSSAGANVALGAAMAAGGRQAGFLRACACVVGLFDGDVDTASMQAYAEAGVLPGRADAQRTLESYLGAGSQHREDPRFNLLCAAPELFPPLFLAAAEHDVYRDSSVKLAAHAATVQQAVTLKVYPGMTHLFLGYSRMVEQARTCLDDLAAFLRGVLPA